MNINHWIIVIDGKDHSMEDIRRWDSGEIVGRWISGGEIQWSTGAEAARDLMDEDERDRGKRYSPHYLSKVGSIRM